MKKTALFLASLLFCSFLVAQTADETEKRNLEREVKTSGNYFYGEAVENTNDAAFNAAISALVTEINQEIANRPEWKSAKTVSAATVKSKAGFIELMRGNKYRVIAYTKKDNLETLLSNTSASTKSTVQNEPPKAEAPKKEEPKKEEPKKEEPKKEEPKKEELKQVETPKEEKIISPQSNNLLGQIVLATSIREVDKILSDNKKKGKVAYGTPETLTNPENAYYIIYKKTGEIVAILDKGTQNLRRDIISGEMKNIEMYKEYQVAWFQIY
jgi:outer membrane biosynthesis protein TonB